MNAEEWLLGARGIDKEIRDLECSYRRAIERATDTTAASIGERVIYSPKNTNEEKMIDVVDYAYQIKQSIERKKQLRRDIFFVIDKVPNSCQRRVLRLYYIEEMTWEEVAEAVDMSDKYVRTKLKERALACVEKIRERLAL